MPSPSFTHKYVHVPSCSINGGLSQSAPRESGFSWHFSIWHFPRLFHFDVIAEGQWLVVISDKGLQVIHVKEMIDLCEIRIHSLIY